MDFPEVRDRLAEAYDFPIAHDALVEEMGDVDLEEVTDGAETVETVLERTDRETYRSPRDVAVLLRGTVGEAYVGRKYYDDRGGARAIPYDHPDESV